MRVKCRNVSISPLMYFAFSIPCRFYADRWIERDAGNIGRGKFIGHAGIEKTAIFSGLYKLQSSVDLATSHHDIGLVTVHFKTHFQNLVLYGISIEKDQKIL